METQMKAMVCWVEPEELNAENSSELSLSLTCPLCRGAVLGWKVVEEARESLNLKPRSCSRESCSFSGNYRELRQHARRVHPTTVLLILTLQESDPGDVLSTKGNMVTLSVPSALLCQMIGSINSAAEPKESIKGFDKACLSCPKKASTFDAVRIQRRSIMRADPIGVFTINVPVMCRLPPNKDSFY
ncbi:hypothetical protein CK203_104962 [Vitis vinifera]|uniref:Uncharacterized protein n=1 Tax=Vitis vinifera TaxID=29760 RepID=A0A438BQB9_VITVI|nr:hypothetical protein CK203_104962 [Vitis vinifera]